MPLQHRAVASEGTAALAVLAHTQRRCASACGDLVCAAVDCRSFVGVVIVIYVLLYLTTCACGVQVCGWQLLCTAV